MPKRDILWLGLRFVGLYLLLQAAFTLVLLPIDLTTLWSLRSAGTPGAALQYDEWSTHTLTHVAELAGLLVLAFYFLRRGKLLLDFMLPDVG